MRTLFIIPMVLMSLVSFPSWGLSMDDLVQRDGLWYEKFNDIPFSGKIDEGRIRATFEDGKREESSMLIDNDDTKITFVDFEWSDTLTYDEWKSDWDLTSDEWEEWEKRFNH